jgi:DNA-binding NarL/FixJ family response regulator
VEVVGTAATADELVDVCRAHGPDVALAEVDAHGTGVGDIAARLLHASVGVRLVGVYESLPVARVRDAKRAGFAALLPRSGGIEPILRAARSLPPVRTAVIPLRRTGEPRPRTLTPRERTVLTLIGAGCTSHAVGRQMNISQKTVENHKQRIFQKLGVQNQAHAVSVAIREGLIALARTVDVAL